MSANDQRGPSIWSRVKRHVSKVRQALGNTVALSFAVVAIIAVVAAIAVISAGARQLTSLASGHGTGTNPNATPTLIRPSCGTSTTPACPGAQPDWIPLTADTPQAVLAAWRQSSLYAAAQSSNATGRGDAQYDISRPETPVFVRELHAPGSVNLPDVWVIPFDTADGMIGYAVVCNINASHTAIEVASISGIGTPRPHGQLARVTENVAVSSVEAQSHTELRPGAQPYLVTMAIDANQLQTGQIVWKAGGLWPGDPLWLVPGADGRDRVLGDDGEVYLASQIPLAKAS
jgi:hypothetical protein